MNKKQVLEIIKSYPTKKEQLKEIQAELAKLINEKETGIGSLPCSLGKTDGGGSGISDTTYRKAEKAMRYNPEIEELNKKAEEIRKEIEPIEKALNKLEPVRKTVLMLREIPKYDEKRERWERTLSWQEISNRVNYSRMQCSRIYNNALCSLEKMLHNVT